MKPAKIRWPFLLSFLAFLAAAARAQPQQVFPVGFQPNPFQPSGLAPGRPPVGFAQAAAEIPAACDWRARNAVSIPKNQGSYGVCWIFSGIGAIESARMLAGFTEPDYSEQDVLEGLAEGASSALGGNPFEVANHLTKYATLRNADNLYGTWPSPIPITSYWAPPKGTPQIVPTQWRNLGDLCELSQVATLKAILLANGPLSTAMSVNDVNAWSKSSKGPGVYFNGGSWNSNWVIPMIELDSGVDHMVLLVGWDDNRQWYGTTNSASRGAWLVKNSWGTAWGAPSADAGYFWIAYGSAGMGTEVSYYPAAGLKPYDPGEQCLYYDELGSLASVGWSSSYSPYFLNRFTPVFSGSRGLKAVDFWAPYQNLAYEIRIFDTWNGTSSSPSQQLGSTLSGSLADSGYYSIPLPEPLLLTSGNEICVQVRLTDPSNSFTRLVPYEYAFPWFQNPRKSETGKSFARRAATAGWIELSGSFGDAGIRIRIAPFTAATPTPTATRTPTRTPTRTASPTATRTASPTPTPSPTRTPVISATPSPSQTPTALPALPRTAAHDWHLYR